MWCCLEMVGPESQSSIAALPSRGSTEWRKLCLDFSLFMAGSCSCREDAEGRFLVCVSQAGMILPV